LVERAQHAVGHGGFHTGSIKVFEPRRKADPIPSERQIESFWYVYDCGSEQHAAFQSALASYRSASRGHTDILFVSHLHSDHINGIERLQAMAPATTVVVPYLDVIERLLFVLSDIEAGSASSSSLEYFGDPTSWWQRRGARQIIFLQPGHGDDEPPVRRDAPDAPIDGDGEREEASKRLKREQKEPEARLAWHLRPPKGRVPVGLTPANKSERRSVEAAILAGTGSSFQLEWCAHTSSHYQVGDWILLPYVHPADEATRRAFRRKVKKALDVSRGGDVELGQRLIEHLTSYEKTKDLLDLYGAHFGRGHNALSMSLYSGPFCSRREHPCDEDDCRQMWHTHVEDVPPYLCHIIGQAGWLGTGDAALKEPIRRDPWLRFFEPYAGEVGVMTLPHHGSAHNFHEEILAFDGLKTALATTVERRKRVARMRETLDLVEARGISTRVVDDEYRNGFSVRYTRLIGR
jgi:hypothetical protein